MTSLARLGLLWVVSLVMLVTFLTLHSTQLDKTSSTPTTFLALHSTQQAERSTPTNPSPLHRALLRPWDVTQGDDEDSMEVNPNTKDDNKPKPEETIKRRRWRRKGRTETFEKLRQLMKLAKDKGEYSAWISEWKEEKKLKN